MSVIDLRTQTSSAMSLMRVTPETAQRWLTEANSKNRKLSQHRVLVYANTMRQGLWRHPTGEPIIFDAANRLQDGQHRLAAQVQAGVTIDYWVMTGASPDDFSVIDQGRSRKASDVLGMNGIPNSTQVAATTRTFLYMREASERVWSGGSVGGLVVPAKVTEFALAFGTELNVCAREADLVFKATRIPRTAYSATSFYLSHMHHGGDQPAQWLDFTQAVVSGANLQPDSPILALRNWAVGRPTDQGVRQQLQVALIAKAWNAYVNHKSTKILRWQTSSLPMPLPKPASY